MNNVNIFSGELAASENTVVVGMSSASDTDVEARYVGCEVRVFFEAVVMVGQNTWKSRYVVWEIDASLRNGLTSPANALLGIKIPSCVYGIQKCPDRLNGNLNAHGVADGTPCYARFS